MSRRTYETVYVAYYVSACQWLNDEQYIAGLEFSCQRH